MGRHTTGWSDRIRELAEREYVAPARGMRATVRIPYGELKRKLVRMGFPPTHSNQVATPLESKKFWAPRGLKLCSEKGQRTVDSVLEFRFEESPDGAEVATQPAERKRRALDAFDQMRGLLKHEIAAFGGTEAFMRWVRSDEDEDEGAA